MTVQEKAKEIVQEKKQIIASEKDSQIFFDAIINPRKPSKTLKNAFEDYNHFIKLPDSEKMFIAAKTLQELFG